MGQIAGEAACCVGVALLASGHHICTAEVRTRIGDRQDVVRAVAVKTLGGTGVTEARDFAMVGLEISLSNFGVAFSALIHDFELETGFIGAANLVRAMAVAANRQGLVSPCDGSRVYALDELLLDAVVAGAAGRGNIPRIDGRVRIGAGQDQVRRVAVGASCGHSKAAFHQALAVDALGVVPNNFVLGPGIAESGFHALAVASAAEIRNVGWKSFGLGIVLCENVVRAMAVLANGRIVVAGSLKLPVAAALVLLALILVTLAAIDGMSDGLAGAHMRNVDFRVALATSDTFLAVA